MYQTFNGMRAIAHIYILILHYGMNFHNDIKSVTYTLSVPFKHIFRSLLMYSFVVFFVLNGITSGKIITNHLNKSSQNVKIAIKFYYQRLMMILPLVYIYYTSFYILVKLIFKNQMMKKVMFDSLLANLLLISNIFNVESNVITKNNFEL